MILSSILQGNVSFLIELFCLWRRSSDVVPLSNVYAYYLSFTLHLSGYEDHPAAAARGGRTGLLSGSVPCESRLNSDSRPGSGPWPPWDVRPQLVSLRRRRHELDRQNYWAAPCPVRATWTACRGRAQAHGRRETWGSSVSAGVPRRTRATRMWPRSFWPFINTVCPFCFVNICIFYFLHPWWRYRNTFLTLTLTTLSSNMTNCNIHFSLSTGSAIYTISCAIS